MERFRIRIRFRKQGDLRLISHRDLLRVFERLLRRVGVPLAMSQGFHPRPQMTFPAALALGIEGQAEVVDISVATRVDVEDLQQQLTIAAPDGLGFQSIRMLEPTERKPRIRRLHYQVAIPAQQQAATQAAINQLLEQRELWVERKGKRSCFDIVGGGTQISLADGKLNIQLEPSSGAQVRPDEILKELGLDDLQLEGEWLTRTRVELTS